VVALTDRGGELGCGGVADERGDQGRPHRGSVAVDVEDARSDVLGRREAGVDAACPRGERLRSLGLSALGVDGGILGEDGLGVVEALLVQPPAPTGERVSAVGTVGQVLDPPGNAFSAFGLGRGHHLMPVIRTWVPATGCGTLPRLPVSAAGQPVTGLVATSDLDRGRGLRSRRTAPP